MTKSKIIRSLVAGLAALAAGVASSPAAAQGYSNAQIARLRNEWPMTYGLYLLCKSAAFSEYERTGRTLDAAATLTVCAGGGCILTGDAGGCAEVVTIFFFHDLERSLRGY